jgi:ribosomal protein L9
MFIREMSDIEYEDYYWDEVTKQNLFQTRKPKEKKTYYQKPKMLPIIFTKDCKRGIKGELVYFYKNLAQHMVSKQLAVHLTPETKETYKKSIDKNYDEYWEIKKKRFIKDKRKVILRSVLIFRRKVAGPANELFFPVTRTDVLNKIWSQSKLIIRPEHLVMPQEFKKPGCYHVYIVLEERPYAGLRINITNGKYLK